VNFSSLIAISYYKLFGISKFDILDILSAGIPYVFIHSIQSSISSFPFFFFNNLFNFSSCNVSKDKYLSNSIDIISLNDS